MHAHLETGMGFVIPNLSSRVLEPELMDDPAIPAHEHARALRGLERLNRWSGAARAIFRGIRALVPERGHEISVLDIATGAGDVPRALGVLGSRAGIRMRIDACDISEQGLAIARSRNAGENTRFFALDASREAIPGGYDVVMTNLFMHHLPDAAAIELLVRMRSAARSGVLVNDLVRSRASWICVGLGSRVVTRSRVVRVDAMRSVRAALSSEEMREVAIAAGLDGARIMRGGLARRQLLWRRRDG
jgi:2-polyprenyl-3-methyl-5-hydroxy-6-metoxy-1,4-benzoquinol methylase